MKKIRYKGLALGVVLTGLMALALVGCQNPLQSGSAQGAAERVLVSGTSRIEAESYSAMAGIQVEACSEGGQNVGYIDTGDWLVYPLTVNSAGQYRIEYRIASPNSSGVLSVDINAGATVLGQVAIPATGGWMSWQTVSHTVNLPAGTYNLGLYAQTGGWNINWLQISPAGGGNGIVPGQTYRIISQASGKALDVAGVSGADGANVHQWTYGGTNNQKWRIEDAGGGYYKLTAVHSGKVLDVAGVSAASGANVHQWGYSGGANQQWSITATGSGLYKIAARHSGKVLDVDHSGTADGVNVQVWDSNDSTAQRWQIIQTAVDNPDQGGITRPAEVPADLWTSMVSASSQLGMPADFAWYVAAVCKHESAFGAGLAGSPSAGDGLMQVQGPTRNDYLGRFATAFGHSYNHGLSSDQIALGALILKDMINLGGGSWRVGALKYNGGPNYVPGSVDIYGRPIYAEQYADEVMAYYRSYGGTRT